MKSPLPVPPPPGSSAAILAKYRRARQVEMAKSEIHRRTANIYFNLWWKYMPGTIVEVKWPRGWLLIHEMMDGSQTSKESADPNDHYRPDLEKYVGRQGWDWDWKIGRIAANNGQGTIGHDTLFIKMRKGKDDYASIAKLKWM